MKFLSGISIRTCGNTLKPSYTFDKKGKREMTKKKKRKGKEKGLMLKL
jgi:hypothetical protein